MKWNLPAPTGTWPHSKGAFLIGFGLRGARSLGTRTTGTVNITPTRPMTKTMPMSPKSGIEEVTTVSRYIKLASDFNVSGQGCVDDRRSPGLWSGFPMGKATLDGQRAVEW